MAHLAILFFVDYFNEVDSGSSKFNEEYYCLRFRSKGTLEACRMQVMQLMRQEVAFSAARVQGGC